MTTEDDKSGKYEDQHGNWVTQDELFKGRSEDQITALKFMYGIGTSAGCFKTSYVSSDAYLNLVRKQIEKYSSIDEALSKLGIDEDQVKEIDPVLLSAPYYDPVIVHSKGGDKDMNSLKFSGGALFSRYYEVTLIFFGSEQVYVQSTRFDTTSDSYVSLTEDYFYKDIVSFSVTSSSIQKSVLQEAELGGCGKTEVKRDYTNKTTKIGKFKIGLPGESFLCSYNDEDSAITSKVNAMKQKLREKKQG